MQELMRKHIWSTYCYYTCLVNCDYRSLTFCMLPTFYVCMCPSPAGDIGSFHCHIT